jgi:hypothetical protein
LVASAVKGVHSSGDGNAALDRDWAVGTVQIVIATNVTDPATVSTLIVARESRRVIRPPLVKTAEV